MSWANQLEKARWEWQQQYVAITQVSSPPPPAEADCLGGDGAALHLNQTLSDAWAADRWIIG